MIEIKKVSYGYGQKENFIEILKQIDLNINKGEFVAIMGSSGSGKTTLLNIISRILNPQRDY